MSPHSFREQVKSGRRNFKGITLNNCDLKGLSLQNIDLSYADLEAVDFHEHCYPRFHPEWLVTVHNCKNYDFGFRILNFAVEC